MMCLLKKPNIKPVKNSNGEKYCASKQEAPQGVRKTVEDVCEPSSETSPAKYVSHVNAFQCNLISIVV